MGKDRAPTLKLYEWPLGEILRFRADARLHPDHLWLRGTRVIITGPGEWQRDPNDPGKWEWRQLACSLVTGEERRARTTDLEPLPPDQARGLLTRVVPLYKVRVSGLSKAAQAIRNNFDQRRGNSTTPHWQWFQADGPSPCAHHSTHVS